MAHVGLKATADPDVAIGVADFVARILVKKAPTRLWFLSTLAHQVCIQIL